MYKGKTRSRSGDFAGRRGPTLLVWSGKASFSRRGIYSRLAALRVERAQTRLMIILKLEL